jgi:hypothetical protein
VLLQGWLLDGSAGGSNMSLYGDAVGGHIRWASDCAHCGHMTTSIICCALDRAAIIGEACWHAR